MREKVIRLMDMTTGSFDKMLDAVMLEGFKDGEQINDSMPAELNQFLTKVKSILSAHKDEYEKVITDVYARHLTETDLDQIIEFSASPTGMKLTASSQEIQKELFLSISEWRNVTLDKHRDELQNLLGIEDPVLASANQ
ncbi:MAG: hypothetical protein UY96_C0003G0102 [Parcubacteria group bacterium GW2011_GWB1_56_8]|nr:MAG: hypothetical protein UY96_C0003G0102 [Parcubacteria group bacterium GW2011_GWB1_56_8]